MRLLKILFLFILFSLTTGSSVVHREMLGNPGPEESGVYNGIRYVFNRTDTSYTFKGTFSTSVAAGCFMDVSYLLKHKIRYKTAETEITMVSQGADWYISKYRLHKWHMLENESQWLYRRDPARKRVEFRMLKNKSNLEAANVLKSSSGYYQLSSDKKGSTIEYYQECRVEKGYISHYYLADAKERMLDYVSGYKSYLTQNCTGGK